MSRSRMPGSLSALRALVWVLISWAASSAMAATMTWDPAGNGSGSGGTGTWNTQSWWNGTADVGWTTNDALFQGTGGAVQLATNVSATSLTFNASNYAITGGNTLTLTGSNPTITVGAGYTDSISCLVAGTSGLTTAGGGTLVLYGNNTCTGMTTVSAGTLVAGAACLGTSGTNRVTVNSGATLSVNAGTAANQSGVGLSGIYFPMTAAQAANYDGSSSLQQIALATSLPAVQNLLSANTVGLSTSAGTLCYGNASGLPAGTPQFPYTGNSAHGADQAYLAYFSGMIKINAAGTYTFQRLTGVNDDDDAIFIDGNAVIPGVPASYATPWNYATTTGTISLSAGMHNIVVAYFQGNGGDGLESQISGPDTSNNSVIIGAVGSPQITPDLVVGSLTGSGNVALATGNLLTGFDNTNTTFSGVISGIGGVNKWGSGTVALAGSSSTYTGTTTLVAGILQLAGTDTGAGGPLGVGGPIYFVGGTLQYSPSNAYDYSGRISSIANQMISVDTNGQSVTWGSAIASSGGSLTKLGSGTLTLSGTNTYSGTTLISSGTLALGSGLALQDSTLNTSGSGSLSFGTLTAATIGGLASTGSIALLNGNSAALALSVGNNTATYSGVLSGTGSLTKIGTGTQTLSGANTYTGATTASGGVLNLTGTLGSGAGGGTAVTASASGAVTEGTAGVISGTSSFTNNSAATSTLLGANTYSGSTTLTSGALQANDGVGLPTNSFLSLNGGVLQGNLAASFTRSLGTAGNTFQFANGGGFSANGGVMTVNIGGAATPATMQWGTTVGSQIVGTLQFGSTSANNQTNFENPIDLNGANRTINVTAGTGGDSALISGLISTSSGTAGLTKTGGGTLILNTANTYNGTTTLSGGILQIGTSAALGTSNNVVFGGNASLTAGTSLTLPDNIALGGNIGTFNTNGNTLTLTGSLSNTGNIGEAITVTGGGTLVIACPFTVNGVVNNTNGPALYLASNATTTITGAGTLTGISMGWIGAKTTLNFASTGTVTLSNTVDALDVGQNLGNPGSGVINQTTGGVTVAGNIMLGMWDGGYGNYNLSGGTLNVVNMYGGAGIPGGAEGNGNGNSLIKQTGGTANVSGATVIGVQNAGTNVLHISAGNYNQTAGNVTIGNGGGGLGVVTVTGGNLTVSNGTILVCSNTTANTTGILNLDGGTVQANAVTLGVSGGAGIVDFNGGTLEASSTASAAFLAGLTSANIYSGGATINTNGQNITIGQSLLAASGSGLSSITVSASGTGYIGAPVVRITGGGGTGATAEAVLTGGSVSSFVITNSGTGYTSTPTVTLYGGGSTTAATGTAITAANTTGGGLTKTGLGTLTLSGSNTYIGATTVSAGTLALNFSASNAPASNIISSSSTLALGGNSTLTLTGSAGATNSQTFNGLSVTSGNDQITLNANATSNPLLLNLGAITHIPGSTVNFTQPTGTISGSNGFTTTTANNIPNGILGGWVTVGGTDWATNNGTNIVGLSAVSGGYTTTSSGGTLGATATYANANVDVTNSAGLMDSPISPNSLRFNTSGAYTLTLAAGTNTIVSGGILVTANVGANASVITGGTLTGSSLPELMVIQNNTSSSLQINSSIADNGAPTPLIKNGPGLLVLGGANTYSGTTTISAGTLQLGSGVNGQDGSIAGTSIVNNAALAYDLYGTQTYAGTISGPGTLTKLGSGTLFLTGTNTYTGITTLSAGTLNLGGAENAGTSGPLGQSAANNPGSIVLAGGYLQYSATNQNDYSGRFSTAASQQYNVNTNGQNITWATPLVSASGSLTKVGSGLLTLTASNTYTGATTVSGGTLQLGTGLAGQDGSLATSGITNNAALVYNLAGNQTVGYAIGGNGSLTKLGTGTLTINKAAIDTAGSTYINAGALKLAVAPIGLSNNATFYVNSGGTLAMGAQDMWGNATTYPTEAITVSPGGAVTSNGFYNILNYLTLNGGTLACNGGNSANWEAFGLEGTVTIGGTSTSYIAAAPGGPYTNNSIDLGNQGASTTTFSVTGSANPGLIVSVPLFNAGGAATGNFALTKTGSGAMLLTASNTYTGATTISNGTLQLGTGAVGQDGSIGNTSSLTNNAALVYNLYGNQTAGYNISGTGSLTKNGAGTITLGGSNTYNGQTIINNGTLALGATGSIGKSPSIFVGPGSTFDVSALTTSFTMQNNQVLSGSGAINGNFATAAGSQIQPGTFGTIGTLTFNNNLTLSGGSLDFDLAAPNSPGVGSDLISSGTLTASNATSIVINPLSGFAAGTYKLFGYSNGDGPGSMANISAPAGISGFRFTYSVGSTELDLVATPITGSIWQSGSGGNWSTPGNWSGSNVPNAPGATANLFDSLSPSGTVTLDIPVAIGTLVIDNTGASYTIAGTNILTMDDSGSTAIINVLSNSHAIQAPVFLNSPTTVTVVDPATTFTMSGNIGGTGALTKAGAGIVTLSGSNTFGGTIVSGGTLQIAGPNALPGNTLSITSGVLDLGAYSLTVGSVGMSGGLLQNGALAATNFLISGGEAASSGTLTGNSFALSGGQIDSGAVLSGGSISISGGVIQANATLTAANSFALSGGQIAGILAGSVPATVSGGLVTLSGSNTYNGGTTLSSGTLALGIDTTSSSGSVVTGPVGTGTLAIQNGTTLVGTGTAGSTRTLANALTLAGSVTLAGTQGLTLSGSIDLSGGTTTVINTVPVLLSGTIIDGGLKKSGSGFLQLTGNNIYAGGTTINGGTLNVNGDAALGAVPPTPAVNLSFSNNATLQFTAPMSLGVTRGVNVPSGVTATLDTQGNAVTIGGPFSGGGNLLVPSNANLTLAGTGSSLGGTLTATGTSSLTITGGLSTAGVVTIGSAANNNATLNISGGTLAATAAVTFGAAANTTALNLTAGELTSPAAVTIGNANGAVATVNISGGTLAATFGGAGALILNNVAGGTTIANMSGGSVTSVGEMWIGNNGAGALSLSGGTVTADSWLALGRNTATGFGVLNLSGSGVVVHAVANSVEMVNTGGNAIIQQSGNSTFQNNFGQVQIGASGWGLYTISGGTANFGATTLGNVNANNDSGLGILTVSGSAVVNSTTVTLGTTAGTATANGSGIVTLNGGLLAMTQLTTAGTGANTFNLNGGTLQAAAGAAANFITGLSNINVFSGDAVINTNGQNIAIPQNLVTPGGNGVQSISLSGTGYAVTPAVKISGGGGSGATAEAMINSSGSITGITITNPGTGYTSTPTVTVVSGSNDGVLTSSASATLNSGNTSGGLTVVGSGMLTLSGTNTYTGPTSVLGGTLLVTQTASLPNYVTSGSVSVASGATLAVEAGGPATDWASGNFDTLLATNAFVAGSTFGVSVPAASSSFTYSNDIGSAQANKGLAKLGPGLLILNGTNSYTGVTTVSGGSLQFGSGGATPLPSTSAYVDNGTLIFNSASNLNAVPINGTGSLIQAGGGVVTVSGTNAIGGSLTLRGGLTVPGNVIFTASGTTSVGDVSGTTGLLTVQNGATLSTNLLYVGSHGSATGIVNQAGGLVASTSAGQEWRIGGSGSAADAGAAGTYDLSGGSLLATGDNFQVGAYGQGWFNQSGGTISVSNWPCIGRFAGGGGHATITAGTLSQTNTANGFIVGESGTGELTVSGSGVVNIAGTNGVRLVNQAGGAGMVNLGPGGTIVTPAVDQGATGTGGFNFNGGTLRASGSNTTFLQGITAACVNGGGAVIDDGGNAITINQNLLAPAANGVTGFTLTNPGSGYIAPPLAGVSAPGTGGVQATAYTTINAAGQVTGIVIGNPGSGYSTPPTFTIAAAPGDTTGSGAAASPVVTANTGGGLTKVGSGTLTLGGTNTYGGNTFISAGTLALGSGLALQDSTLDTSGNGALSFDTLTAATFGGLTSGGNLALNNTASAAVALSVGNNAVNTTYSGALSGNGSLTKIGTGTLTLSGSNGYTGGTTVNTGVLDVQNGSALGSGVVNVNSDTGVPLTSLWLDSPTGITVANNFTTTGNGAGNGGDPTGPGVIRNVQGNNVLSGVVTLTSGGGFSTFKSNSGNLTISGTVTNNTQRTL